MNRTCTALLVAASAGMLAVACHSEADLLPWQEVPGAAAPVNFPAPTYNPAYNQPNRAAFELGRKLFYDPRLSRDGTISCGSCHQQSAAFAHAGFRTSPGIDDQLGTRNAQALQNLRWRRELMWDGAAANLEVVALAPLTHPAEMGETPPNVLRKLNADAEYRRRFRQVYDSDSITSQQMLRALAQFLAGLTSANSRYDRYVRDESSSPLTAPELRGLAIFKANCAGCHATDLFTDESYRNNGLDRHFPADSGRVRVTGRHRERGLFKVPSLRNVALTAPYMHDGRFQTLKQVLAHYETGVQESATLDPLLRRSDGQLGISLNNAQRTDLQTFLLTLTDEEFINNPQLAAPL